MSAALEKTSFGSTEEFQLKAIDDGSTEDDSVERARYVYEPWPEDDVRHGLILGSSDLLVSGSRIVPTDRFRQPIFGGQDIFIQPGSSEGFWDLATYLPWALSEPGSLNISGSSWLFGTDSTEIELRLDIVFNAARDERFEPGMNSRFASELERLLRWEADVVISLLKKRLSTEDNADILSEMLSCLVRENYSMPRDSVIEVLAIGLNHTSPLVRDAAALAISVLGEEIAVPYLRMAIEKEEIPELKEDLEDLFSSLEP